jgi:hypothetical protein
VAEEGILAGSCLCGGVTFDLSEPFIRISNCHCTTCKRLSGGTGTVTGRVRTESVHVRTGRELITTYQPHDGTAKSFCSRCGSNLFGSGWPDSEYTGVRISALDSPFDQKPQMHIWVQSVAPWETLPDDSAAHYPRGAPGP